MSDPLEKIYQEVFEDAVDYMKDYYKRKKIERAHEYNDLLHAKNTERFIDDAQR